MTTHLSREQLLRHLDGELSRSDMRKTSEHLRACWSCQEEFSRLKEQVAEILDAQTAVFGPSLAPPPSPWPRLEPRLDREMSLIRVPFWRKLVAFAGGTWRAQLAYGGAVLAVLVTVFLVWVSSVMPVSAQEVLRRASAADAGRLAITDQQVVRQRVRVKRTRRLALSEPATLLESWKSVKSTHWGSAGDPVSAELLERYRANGLASALPLSPPAVDSWAKIAGSEPSASRDGESIDVQVVSNSQGRARGLEEVRFHVQRGNWHLDEMTLSFTDATYQITEESSSVLARNEVPGDVMALLEPPRLSPAVPALNFARTPPPAVNLDDLEMGVRFDLHGIGADLGEGVEISARPPDQVVVDARQVSPQTKERVLALLANRPGVNLEFQEPGATGLRGQAVTRTIPQAATSSTPLDQRLVAFFGSTEAQENYTRLALEAGNDLLERLYALGNLAGRWPPDQESGLSRDSRSRLETMVRDHERGISRAATALEKQLEPFLKSFGYTVGGNLPALTGAGWQDASASGLDAARRVDRILRSLLTSSDTPLSPEQALPQLQRSFRDLQQAVRELSAAAE
jgi:hypothetical protein